MVMRPALPISGLPGQRLIVRGLDLYASGSGALHRIREVHGLSAAQTILGSSVKVAAGERKGILTAVAYMLPAGSLCPHATAECRAACLGHSSGHMLQRNVRAAQRWRTELLLRDPVSWVALVIDEIHRHRARAETQGMAPAVRIDGTSDTGIGAMLAPYFEDVQFYDYTKNFDRAMAYTAAPRANYRVVYSRSGANADQCRRIMRAGGSVSAVFRGAVPVHGTVEGWPIIDGTTHDARFLDPPNSIVGLALKGTVASKARAGTFAIDPSDDPRADYQF